MKLEAILRKKANKNVICGGEINGRTGLWWCESTDDRNSKVEYVIMAWDIQVLNVFSR